MKKMIIAILAILTSSNFLKAQDNVRFGFTTSPGISWMSPDNKNIKSDGARFSFNYGAIVDFYMDDNQRYAISTGLTINMNGGNLIGTGLYSDTSQMDEPMAVISKITPKLQYLEIPVGLKLRSNETSNNLTYYGLLGLTPGFTIRSRGDYSFQSGPSGITVEETNIKIKELPFYPNTIDNIIPFHLSMQFEGGVEYRVGDNTSLVGGLFFRNGFTNMVDDNDGERIVGRAFGLRVAVMF
jgi:hypothetical protein